MVRFHSNDVAILATMTKIQEAAKKLSLGAKLSYSVGHVLNDLTASMWFSYYLVYLTQVKTFNNRLAGDLILIGQVVDALATPFIGYESDRTSGLFNMGKRKSWHFVGTLCVFFSFAFLFNGCITCDHAPDYAQFIYFIPFVIIFQFGWASTQISHLSLIPDLTPCENERVGLNGLRYALTVLSNLTVYAVAWVLLAMGSQGVDISSLGPEDVPKFRDLVFIVLGIGVVFSVIFHVGTRENPAPSDTDCHPEVYIDSTRRIRASTPRRKKTVNEWLHEPLFYLIGILYMSTRLFINLTQVYLPLYLTKTLELDQFEHVTFHCRVPGKEGTFQNGGRDTSTETNIAIVPLISYMSGFVTSFAMKPLNKYIGGKASYIIGGAFALGSCIWLFLIQIENSSMVFGANVLSGIGGAIMLVTSLALTSDLIGDNTDSGAFVFGFMSFTDKLSNGIGVMIIQSFEPCRKPGTFCPSFFRIVQSVVPGSSAVLGSVIAIVLLVLEKRKTAVKDAIKLSISTNRTLLFKQKGISEERSPLLGQAKGSLYTESSVGYKMSR